jgi:hypothetical protein
MIGALQRIDPRCNNPVPSAADADADALQQLQKLLKPAQ